MSYEVYKEQQDEHIGKPEGLGSSTNISGQDEYPAVPNVENSSTVAPQIENPNAYYKGVPSHQSFVSSAGENKKGGLTTSTFRGIRKEIEAKLAERHS